MRDINIKSIAKIIVILMIGMVSRYGVSGQMPTVAAGHTIRVHATGGMLAGKYLRGIVADPISGNVFVAASTVAPVINQCCYLLPDFSLYKITPAGVVSLVGTYTFRHYEIIKMAWGPDGLIYTADLATGTIRTINPVTAASAIYSTNNLYSNSRYGLQFDPSGNLIYSPEAIFTFYKVTPAGPVTLGNVTASLPNGNHGDAFGIQPNGNYIVYPDCGAQNVYSINTAGHVTGANYPSVAWTGTSNLLTNTFYGAGACAYSNGAIDPYTGDIYSIIANAGNGIPRIVYTPAAGGASSVFVSGAGNGGTPDYQVGSGITDLVFGKATNGCSKSLFFVDMTKNTVYEVIPVCSQPPTISCPSNINVSNALGICGANVTYPIATVTGNPAPTVIYSNASGSFFPVGTTTVTVSASDGIGNTATCSFTVTVTGGVDTDNDGTVNVCDPDDDNDGILDEDDCDPLVASAPIVVTAVASNNATGPVAPQAMIFSGAGQNVTFVGQGPGAKLTGGRTNIYSNINTSSYAGLWWTFTPIENPRHSSQGSSTTGQMVFNSYDPVTRIITFTSTANMIWQSVNHTENIATRLRMQLQPYTGTHSGPIATGLPFVTAGGISFGSLNANYPLIDIKALGSPAAYQVWYIIETASGVPLDVYYGDPAHNSSVGGQTVTSQTGSFFSSTLSTCNGGPATVTVTATGGTGPYIGTGVFSAAIGEHTYTVTDANGCSGSATIDVEGQNCIELQCVENKIVSTDAGSCVATVMNIDPIITPSNAIVNYKIEKGGIELETGVGSVSGKTFAKGITTVTYTAVDEPTKTCSFTVTVTDDEKPTFICPGNQNINLNATCQLVVPNLIAGLTGSDNCGTVTFTQSPIAGASFAALHNQTHNVVITANDGNGNTQTCIVILTGKDVTQPTFNCPSNQNVNLNATCQLIVPNLIAELSGNDNCGTVTFTQSPLAGASLASSHNQTHNVVITASDGNGNTQTCTVVLTGKDVTQPTFNCPSNRNVNLNGSCQLIIPNLIAGLTGNDNCGTVMFTQSPIAGASLASSHNQTHNVVITANDGNGNTQTCTVVLSGKDVTQPTFNCPSNQNVNLNGSCQLIVPNLIAGLTGNDNCGTVTFTQSPVAGASFASSHNQTHNVVITANDGNGNTQTRAVVLSGKDVTQPTFNCPSNQNVNLNGSCQLIVPNLISGLTGSDNCGTVTFTQSPLAGASFASSHNQTHNVVITASDGNGNTQTCTVVLTGKDVTQPTFNCPSNQNVNLNGTCQLIVPNLISGLTGSDNCGTVTFTQSPLAGASFASSHNQTHNVVITASDGNGHTQTCTVVLTGKDVTQPTFNCPSNQNVNLNGTCQLIVPNLISGLTGSDNCGTVTFTQSPLAGASFASSHNQTHNVVITASDGNGNTQACTVVLTGKDVTQPTFNCPSNQNVNLNGTCQLIVPNLIAGLTGNDNCGTVTFTQSPVAGASFSSSNNQTYNIVITARDGNGNTQTCAVLLTGKDVTKPTVTAPTTVDLECSGNLPAPATTITQFLALAGSEAGDNCTAQATLVVSSSDGPLLNGNCNGTITRKYTITDGAGNATTVDHVFTITDNTLPVINTCPGNGVTFIRNTNAGVCTYQVAGTEFNATGLDNCTGVTMSYSIVNEHNQGTVTGTGSLAGKYLSFGLNTITWIATDGCGNNSVACAVKVDVDKITTTTTLTVNPASQQYSDLVTLTATVTPNNCTGAGNIGGTVTFKIGSLIIGTAPVINGIATVTSTLLEDMLYDANLNDPMNPTNGPLKPGAKTVTAYFSGTDDDYIVTNPTAPLTVTCENADITYNGQTYFSVSPNTNAGTVVLSNYVVDKNDAPTGARGDIRNATATFWQNAINGSVLGTANVPVGLVNPANKQEGLVTTSFNDVLSNTDISNGGKVYEVWSGLNNYYCENSDTYTPVTLGLPGQDFVTGGGFIVFGNNSAGTYAGTQGKRMNFGFVMKWNSSGKNLQGRVNVVYRKMVNGVQRIYQIKSNAINSLVIENVNDAGLPATGTNIRFRRATISTKANLADITDPLNPISLGGNLNLTLIGWESTTVTTGALDRVNVQLSGSGSIGLLFSSNWLSGNTSWQTLNGGKIQVRNPSTPAPGQRTTASEEIITKTSKLHLLIKAFPNPSQNYFNLTVEGNRSEDVVVSVYNVSGVRIHQVKGNANRIYKFGEAWIPGTYLVEVRQGNELKTVKLVKQ